MRTRPNLGDMEMEDTRCDRNWHLPFEVP